jgi:hypothetical protein
MHPIKPGGSTGNRIAPAMSAALKNIVCNVFWIAAKSNVIVILLYNPKSLGHESA